MKKLFVVLLALVVILSLSAFAHDSKKASSKSGDSKSMNGWISDEMCGAKGADAKHADCAKKCAEGGQKAVFVTENDKKVMAIDNPEAVKGHEGHHVKVTGSVKDGALHVDQIAMLGSADTGAEKSSEHAHAK